MKKSVWGIVAVTLFLAMWPLAAQAAPPSDERAPFWRAEYYDNPGLAGSPKFVTSEDTLSHDWGKGAPALNIPADHFSARFTTTRYFERGSHLFVLTVDDGARVWFDGKLILDAWNIGQKVRFRAKVYVETAGNHEIQVAYFEDVGYALIVLESIQLGSPQDIVSSWRGEYFNNQDLEGNPVLVRQDPALNFDWSTGSPSPKVPRDRFSVRWRRNTYLLDSYCQIKIRHDDGMRIYIDDKLIYDAWFDQSATNKEFWYEMKEGYHTFIVEYYDHLGDAVAQVNIYGENR